MIGRKDIRTIEEPGDAAEALGLAFVPPIPDER